MRVTIQSIADMIGTSRSTVDRALKGIPGVRPEMRKRVLEVAEEYGYKSNLAARALRKQNSPIKIAVVLLWRKFEIQMKEGILAAEEEFSDLGIKLKFFDLKTDDYKEQVEVLKKIQDENIQGVIIKPADHLEVLELVNELEASDIKVVTLSSDLPNSNRFRFIGQNYYQAGRVAGSLMVQILPTDCKIVIFQESNEYHAYLERVRGFQDVIAETDLQATIDYEIHIAEGSPNNYDQALKYFKENPDVNGVLCTGISYPLIAAAIRKSKKLKALLIGYDLFDESTELFEANVLDYVITQNPFLEGYESVRTLFHYYFSETAPTNPIYYTPLQIVNKECVIDKVKQ